MVYLALPNSNQQCSLSWGLIHICCWINCSSWIGCSLNPRPLCKKSRPLHIRMWYNGEYVDVLIFRKTWFKNIIADTVGIIFEDINFRKKYIINLFLLGNRQQARGRDQEELALNRCIVARDLGMPPPPRNFMWLYLFVPKGGRAIWKDSSIIGRIQYR